MAEPAAPRTWNRSMEDHFARLAETYDESAQWRGDKRLLAWFRDAVSGARLCLDLATGTGLVGGAIRGRDLRVCGVDRSLAMLRQARGRVDVVVCGDAHALPMADHLCDAVCVRQLFHYVDERACLRELHRVTAAGATLACAHVSASDGDVAAWWRALKRDVQPLRRRFHADEDLRRLVDDGGFAVERQETLDLVRDDPWSRFLTNCPDGRTRQAVRERLAAAPPWVVEPLQLEISESGVRYVQHWCLIRARRRAAPGTAG